MRKVKGGSSLTKYFETVIFIDYIEGIFLHTINNTLKNQHGMLFPTKCRCSQHSSLPYESSTQALTKLLQVSNINHPLNINKKYEHICRVDQTKETGLGIKKVLFGLHKDFCLDSSRNQGADSVKNQGVLG